MDITLENSDTVLRVRFNSKKHKQKLLIQALLVCSELDFEMMASLLNISVSTLIDVSRGLYYLKSEQAVKLVTLFLIQFTDNITFM